MGTRVRWVGGGTWIVAGRRRGDAHMHSKAQALANLPNQPINHPLPRPAPRTHRVLRQVLEGAPRLPVQVHEVVKIAAGRAGVQIRG